MKVTAIMRAQNIDALDFPLEAALHSAASFCDEIVLAINHGGTYLINDIDFGDCVFKTVAVKGGYDADWQVRFWNAAVEASTSEWLYLHDADECVMPGMRAELERAVKLGMLFASSPFVHFYGTPRYVIESPAFYKWHTRFGHRDRFWMSNERVYRKGAPICDMIGLTPRGTKLIHVQGSEWTYTAATPVHHYGWCRRDPLICAINNSAMSLMACLTRNLMRF